MTDIEKLKSIFNYMNVPYGNCLDGKNNIITLDKDLDKDGIDFTHSFYFDTNGKFKKYDTKEEFKFFA